MFCRILLFSNNLFIIIIEYTRSSNASRMIETKSTNKNGKVADHGSIGEIIPIACITADTRKNMLK